jgi:hypothetical protein
MRNAIRHTGCSGGDLPSRRQRLNYIGQVLAPLRGGLIVTMDPNNGKLVRELASLHQMVERRSHETLGQISTSAENYQSRGLRLTALQGL